MRKTHHLLFLLFTQMVIACGPVVMHSKGSLPKEEVVFIGFDALGPRILETQINGVESPHPGLALEILPGQYNIKVRYQDRFENSDLAIDDDAVFPDERSGIGLVRVGACEINFRAKAGDSLFVYITPGSYSLLAGTKQPKIAIKEEGFNQPALFEAICSGESRQPLINIHRD